VHRETLQPPFTQEAGLLQRALRRQVVHVAGRVHAKEAGRRQRRRCQRLDGLPLAIELVASRLSAHGLVEIDELIEGRLRLAWRGPRTAPPAHQSPSPAPGLRHEPHAPGKRTTCLLVWTEAAAGTSSTALARTYRSAIKGRRALLIDACASDPHLSQVFAANLKQRRACVLDSEAHLAEIEAVWGSAPGKSLANGGGIFVLGATFGNVFVGLQPPFGIEGDPMRLMFDGGFAPTHAFSAFYRRIREGFHAAAVLPGHGRRGGHAEHAVVARVRNLGQHGQHAVAVGHELHVAHRRRGRPRGQRAVFSLRRLR